MAPTVTITPPRQAMLLLIRTHQQPTNTHTASNTHDHKKQQHKPNNKVFGNQHKFKTVDLYKRQSDQMRRDCHVVRLGCKRML